jgi:dTDP-4-amino-4,6-dideoxygalactose transaminase
MKIPFLSFEHMHQPLRARMLKTFETFYDSNYFVLGKQVEEFEQSYADFNQTSFAVGVSNGLDALHLALRALEIGEGDEVIVPSNTFIATALAVSYTGAKPVFVEPRIDTYNLNPVLIEGAITPNTKVIMPVHLYGQCCEMEAITEIAKRRGLYVIEDNAQAQGATFNGKLTGTWGDINGTSFYPGKNLGALGDAGAITTNDEKLAEKVKMLRNYGSRRKYYNEAIGFNMRLDECQAGFLSIKLKQLKEWNIQRQEIASWYMEELKSIPAVVLPVVAEYASHVYHLFVIRVNERDALQQQLAQNGIGTLIHYPVPPHLQEAYQHLGYQPGDFPIAETIASTCLSLPMWPGLKKSDIQYISKTIQSYYA